MNGRLNQIGLIDLMSHHARLQVHNQSPLSDLWCTRRFLLFRLYSAKHIPSKVDDLPATLPLSAKEF